MEEIIKYLNSLQHNKKRMYIMLDDLTDIFKCSITNDYVYKDIRTISLKKNIHDFMIKGKIIIDNNYNKKEYIEINIYELRYVYIVDY
jgi:hypothetical protein